MRRLVCFLCLFILTSGAPGLLAGQQETIETGRLLAILLDTGRVAVAQYQPIINEPSRGFKNFTPEVFEQQVLSDFQERTGIDLNDMARAAVPDIAKPLLSQLLEESKRTIAKYQDIINEPGVGFKGLIPATFGTETASRFREASGNYLKQTAPDQLLRNPQNKADSFEAEKFADPSFAHLVKGAVAAATTDDGKVVRVMLPLFYSNSCLKCHGEPKGEKDISGYLKEGAKKGALGGAISVQLPVQ
jgi:hypothetical protein